MVTFKTHIHYMYIHMYACLYAHTCTTYRFSMTFSTLPRLAIYVEVVMANKSFDSCQIPMEATSIATSIKISKNPKHIITSLFQQHIHTVLKLYLMSFCLHQQHYNTAQCHLILLISPCHEHHYHAY